jgi:predicted GIY-YIG superfamily endonuclease
MWKVYKLVNSALGECYAGATDGDPQARLREAADGEIEVIDYWDGDEHKITLEILKTFDDQVQAVAFLGRTLEQGKCASSP